MMTEFESVVHGVLSQAFPEKRLRAQRAFTRAGMSPEELVRLYELIVHARATDVLEVGLGSGTSSLVMLSALAETGGRLTSIDPFQHSSFAGAGLQVIAAAGHADRHRLIEKPDYLALPELLAAGRQFDLVLIDGYHSLDYTVVDIFYADLLLRVEGVLAVHDSSWPAVLAAVKFLEAHKPYATVSPPPFVRHDRLGRKVLRRLGLYLSPARLAGFKQRRKDWHTLAAYRKLSDRMAPEFNLDISIH